MYHVTLAKEAAIPEPRSSQIEGLIPFTETSYINKTGKYVYLKDRHGAFQTIPPLPAEAKLDGNFHVVVAYHCMLASQLSFDNQDINFQEATIPSVARRAATKYSIDPKDCVSDEIIFSKELGLLISFNRPLNVHDVFPDTSRVVTDIIHQTSERVVKSVDLSINIVVVDNINPGSPYYINIENRVYRLDSRTSTDAGNLPDGVHILDTRTPVAGSREARYDIKDCIYNGDGKFLSPFTLFTNPHDAKTNGNRTALLEADRQEMERLMKKQDTELLHLKGLVAKAKEEALIRKEALDSASDYRRDYYEGRSHRRKDTSEGISMPAKIMAGIGTVAAACFGIFKLLV